MEVKYAPGFKKSFDKCFSKNPIYSIPRFFKDIKWEIINGYKRLFYHVDTPFLWGFTDVFPPMFLKTLEFLKGDSKGENTGYPCMFENREEWDKVLDELIEGFKAIDDLNEMEYGNEEKRKALEEKSQKALELFAKYYFCFWD